MSFIKIENRTDTTKGRVLMAENLIKLKPKPEEIDKIKKILTDKKPLVEEIKDEIVEVPEKEEAVEGRVLIAKGSLDYNGKTFAYEISEMGETLVANVSEILGSKKKEFMFDKNENGVYVSRDVPTITATFDDEILTLNSSVNKLSLSFSSTNGTMCFFGKPVEFESAGRELNLNVNRLINILPFGISTMAKASMTEFLGFFNSFERTI